MKSIYAFNIKSLNILKILFGNKFRIDFFPNRSTSTIIDWMCGKLWWKTTIHWRYYEHGSFVAGAHYASDSRASWQSGKLIHQCNE